MKIHLVKKLNIERYFAENPRSRSSLLTWLTKVKFADWNQPSDIKKTFGSADFLGNGTNRIVFDIGGNNYRMICKYYFGPRLVHLFVCWIGIHSDYDELCGKNQQYTINIY